MKRFIQLLSDWLKLISPNKLIQFERRQLNMFTRISLTLVYQHLLSVIVHTDLICIKNDLEELLVVLLDCMYKNVHENYVMNSDRPSLKASPCE